MAKFDFMEFTDGWDNQYVGHQKKYTKEEFVKLCNDENKACERPLITIDDIIEATVRYYVKAPDTIYDYNEFVGGCYSFCNEGQRGSFRVWVACVKKKEGN